MPEPVEPPINFLMMALNTALMLMLIVGPPGTDPVPVEPEPVVPLDPVMLEPVVPEPVEPEPEDPEPVVPELGGIGADDGSGLFE